VLKITLMSKSKIFFILFFLYILSLAFQDFMHLSGIYRKVQLPEMLFLLLLITFPFNYFKQYDFKRADYLLIGALSVYWFANIVSSAMSGVFSAIAESFGRLYLIILFVMATTYFAQLSQNELRQKVINASIGLGGLLSLTSILGIVAHFCGFPNRLVGVSEGYPYLGTVYRAQGFTHTPAMLVSLLTFTGIIVFTEGVKKGLSRWGKLALGFTIIAAVLTFSRSMFFLFWGLFLLIIFQKWDYSRKILMSTTVILTLFMTVGTHIIFISKTNPSLSALYASPFTSNRILFEQGNYIALETSYLAIKRASIQIWQSNPLWGIGTGNFMDGVEKMQKLGIYPAKLPIYEAHSTYLGTLAENGIFAAAALILFYILLWRRINIFIQVKVDAFSMALTLCLLITFIEGIALDTMNFRHYWLLYALVWAYPRAKNALN
jgi:O-antigen ligase